MVDEASLRDVVRTLGRRYSTATVLFHQAVAAHLGLAPGDHKCLDLLWDRGPLTASELAALAGLTTGAVTGVVARLEAAGRLRREPDAHDRRKQLLHVVPEGVRDVQLLFDTVLGNADALLDGFDDRELRAVARFLERGIALAHRRTALLRADRPVGRAPRRTPAPTAGEPL